MSNQSAPIGVFDSGLGGLTVVKAIKSVMPYENIIYLGDTVHMPYGEKSEETLLNFSNLICHFLRKKSCKIIVVACNSASSAIASHQPEFIDIPIINVVEPVVGYIHSGNSKHIGIIGTKRTIDSQVYLNFLEKRANQLKISALKTPLLAPMIEEGIIEGVVAESVTNMYLKRPELAGIDALVPACTHYPMIEELIKKFLPENCSYINTPQIVAESIQETLGELNLLNKKNNSVKDEFYLTELTESFQTQAKAFLNQTINLKTIVIPGLN